MKMMDTPERRDLIMIKMNVKFETPEQLVEFSRMCQKVEADTLIEDTAHKLIIDSAPKRQYRSRIWVNNCILQVLMVS